MAQIMTKRKFVFDVCFSFGCAQFLESFKPFEMLTYSQSEAYVLVFISCWDTRDHVET